MGNGPFWKKFIESEKTFCRNNWWINLLNLNNYISYDTPCMQHAWFLAADFQLMILGAIIFTIIWKYPNCVIHTFSSLIALSMLTIFIVVYMLKLEVVLELWPEYMKHILVYAGEFQHLHIATHSSIGNFTLGLISGYIYNRMRKSDINLKTKNVNIFYFQKM